jgi:hypothetical protein
MVATFTYMYPSNSILPYYIVPSVFTIGFPLFVVCPENAQIHMAKCLSCVAHGKRYTTNFDR